MGTGKVNAGGNSSIDYRPTQRKGGGRNISSCFMLNIKPHGSYADFTNSSGEQKGSSMYKGLGCASENLNSTPKGDQCGRGSSFI